MNAGFLCIAVSLPLTLTAASDTHCLPRLWEPMAMVADDSGRVTLYYGDEGGRLHRLDDKGSGFRETKQVGVSAAVRALAAADLDGLGGIDIVIATSDGQLAVYDGETLASLWRSQDETYPSITALVVANVDQDPQLEILLLTGGRLVIVDGANHFKEWTSADATTATDCLVADVDGDGELEIVLSSGIVLSTVFFQAEWDLGESFGRELFLLDIEGDETPELVARSETGGMRIFSLKDRREIW
ncbi:hypothetical protein JXA88_13555 [Candidatus Fermentibacteria bacterium]|nr:hypothetical protein [Candidatus Fermentibacteria bacterium]